jgi:hypothetical protein
MLTIVTMTMMIESVFDYVEINTYTLLLIHRDDDGDDDDGK